MGKTSFQDGKEGEGQAVRSLLEQLDLVSAIFTLDALRCQKTLKQIKQSDSRYVVQIKDNCSTLVAQAQQLRQASLPRDSFFSREMNRGRLEMRWVRLYDWLQNRE